MKLAARVPEATEHATAPDMSIPQHHRLVLQDPGTRNNHANMSGHILYNFFLLSYGRIRKKTS